MTASPLPASKEEFAKLLAVDVEPGEAYRKSGVGVFGMTVSEVTRSADVQSRVAWLKAHPETARSTSEPVIAPNKVGKMDVIAMLLKDRELARSTGQASAAVRAGELIGKELGMFIDRKIVDLTVLDKMSIEEQRALLDAIELIPSRRMISVN